MIALDEKKRRRETASDTLAESDQAVLAVAREALRRYCLGGCDLCLLGSADNLIYRVNVPADRPRIHPYLGNIAGKRLTLQLRPSDGGRLEATRLEVEWLAALLRDTNLTLPEPVPACDGSLFPTLHAEDLGEVHVILLRWPAE